MVFGITTGDSSGIGPEVLLRAFKAGALRRQVIAYGDREVLDLYNERLACGVELRSIASPSDYRDGVLNVIDHGLLRREEVTIGDLNAASGSAAREYVVSATRAALAGDIAAVVTLPMNKEATQLSDPTFVGHTVSFPGIAAYASSKSGLIGLTQSLAVEFGQQNVRVNALLPGATDTAMYREMNDTPAARDFIISLYPMRRIASPEEMARSVLYLASDASSFTTGTALMVEGGISINRT